MVTALSGTLEQMWLFYALLAGALYSGEMLVTRHFLRAQKDTWAFSFFYSLVGAIICLPFMLASPQLPATLVPWLLACLIGLAIVGHNLLVFRASGRLEASFVGAISKLRLAWVFLLGVVVLHNTFSWPKLLGTILAIAAGTVIVVSIKRPRSAQAVLLILAATFLNAGIVILSKYLLGSFNALSLTFFAIFLPATVFNFMLMPNALARIKKLSLADWPRVLLACSLGAFANLVLFLALTLRDASSVLVISEVFLIIVLVGEHIILKEQEYLWVKLVSITLAVAGAVLIQIS